MASAQAQAFFDKQSPKDRMAIIDSWGGRDLTDEWFNNAKAAGSVPAAAAAPAAAAPAAAPAASAVPPPGEDFNSWFQRANAAGGGNFDPNSAESKAQYQQHLYTMAHPGEGGGMGGNAEYGASSDPTGMRAYAKSQGLSEDYARFSNAQLASWESQKNAGCPPNAPYSAFDGSGCVEKPVDSNRGAADGGGGGQGGRGGVGGAAAAGPGAAPAYFGQDDPLQRMLTNQMASAGGSFAGTTSGGQFAGGGVFSEGAGQYGKPATTGTANPAATAALAALAPAAPIQGGMTKAAIRGNEAAKAAAAASPGAELISKGVNGLFKSNTDFSPLAGSTLAAQGVSAAFKAPGAEKLDAFGIAPGTGGLADLVHAQRQKKDARTGGSWF